MPTSFLDLEPHIRDKIYRYSVVTRSCPIDLAKERGRCIRAEAYWLHWSRLPDCRYMYHPEGASKPFLRNLAGLECFCDPVPLQLLSCCSKMFQEVGTLFWSQNTFKFLWPGRGCRIFQQLDPSYTPWIRSLHVSLNGISPIYWNPELSAELSAGIEALFTTIFEKCRVAELNFTLDCEVNDSIGLQILRHRFGNLFGLKSCAVRLGKSIGETVLERDTTSIRRKQARQMVVFATGNHMLRDGGKSWWDMPKETRLNILRFTDLVFRWRQGWEFDGLVVQDGKCLVDKDQPKCCKNCSVCPEATCCCPQFGPSWSSTCTCYSVPGALFAVSRQFALEAREVFFMENRFIFRGDPRKTLSFFKDGLPETLPLFRKIDMQLERPLNNNESTELAYETKLAWGELVSYISRRLNIPALSLSVDTGYAHESCRKSRVHCPLFDLPTVFIHLMVQHARFRELRSFHVFWCCTNMYEAIHEQIVMGRQYHSLSQGKVPYTRRNPYFPHGVPRQSLEWPNGLLNLA